LYADDLGPAEEVESDRQQRVYRGQPSTVGQVARDRDGLRHQVTNAIPVSIWSSLLTYRDQPISAQDGGEECISGKEISESVITPEASSSSQPLSLMHLG